MVFYFITQPCRVVMYETYDFVALYFLNRFLSRNIPTFFSNSSNLC